MVGMSDSLWRSTGFRVTVLFVYVGFLGDLLDMTVTIVMDSPVFLGKEQTSWRLLYCEYNSSEALMQLSYPASPVYRSGLE